MIYSTVKYFDVYSFAFNMIIGYIDGCRCTVKTIVNHFRFAKVFLANFPAFVT